MCLNDHSHLFQHSRQHSIDLPLSKEPTSLCTCSQNENPTACPVPSTDSENCLERPIEHQGANENQTHTHPSLKQSSLCFCSLLGRFKKLRWRHLKVFTVREILSQERHYGVCCERGNVRSLAGHWCRWSTRTVAPEPERVSQTRVVHKRQTMEMPCS